MYRHQYYLEHKEVIQLQSKNWQQQNIDKSNLSKSEWLKRNKEQRILTNIRYRCNNPKQTYYENYGGRGIKCLIKSPDEIVSAIGKWPGKGYSIDRINNDGHYEIGNIRWATPKQQANNRRNRMIEL